MACNITIDAARAVLEAAGFDVRFNTLPEKPPKENDEVFTLYCVIAAVLVLVAGLMSGLTLGLMSLDALDLEVLRRSGTEQEQKYAKIIEPVIKRPHWLLVTLVLVNAAATEALPLFLDRLADPITAVLVSVTVVLIFGEIIPQAVCSRHGLAVGAHSAWFVRILMVAFAGIAYPISKVLDYLLGAEHTALFRRAQLKALVDAHGLKEGLGGNLSHDEITVIQGALDLTHKTAADCMTPMDKVFMLPSDAVLEEHTLADIILSGHSRVPVHRPGNRHKVIGMILVKELALIDKHANTPLSNLKMRSLPFLRANMPLYDLLRLFETGRCHMAVLSEAPETKGGLASFDGPLTPLAPPTPDASQGRQLDDLHPLVTIEQDDVMQDQEAAWHDSSNHECCPVGVITLEDCLEELIQQEIVDETDRYIDNEQRQRVNAQLMLRSLPPRLRKMLLSRQFHPRIGALAAVNMSKRQQDAHGALTEPLLRSEAVTVNVQASATSRPVTRPVSRQVSDVSGQRLLSAMDMLKPILAESPPEPPASMGGSQNVVESHQQIGNMNAHRRNKSIVVSNIV